MAWYDNLGTLAGTGLGAAAGGLLGGVPGALAGASIGGAVGGGLQGSLDRAGRAEDKYGGVNAASMGVPNYGAQYNQYGQMADAYGRRGPGSSAFYGDQRQLGNILRQEAMGQGVGQQLVGMQARGMADRSMAQQFGASQTGRPGQGAMAARNAALGGALAQSQAGEQAALGSAQMTLGAQGQYGQFLQGARGQDLQLQGMNDQAQLEALRQRMGLSGMQQQGALTAEQLRAQRYGMLMGQPTQGEIMLGGITGALSAYAGMPGKQATGTAKQTAPAPSGGQSSFVPSVPGSSPSFGVGGLQAPTFNPYGGGGSYPTPQYNGPGGQPFGTNPWG